MYKVFALVASLSLITSCSTTSSPTICGDADLACIPFNLSTGRPVIDAVVGGNEVPVSLIFDTGSAGFLVSESLKDQAGLKEGPPMLVGSPAGGEPVSMNTVNVEQLKVGTLTVSEATALVIPPHAIRSPGADGVIGPRSIGANLVTINLASKTLSFPTQRPPTEASWQPLDEQGLPSGILEIGGEEIPVHIDTGNPTGLMLPISYADRLPLQGELVEVGAVRTIDAELPIYLGKLDTEATIAGIRFQTDSVFLVDLPLANIGNDALEGLSITIDMDEKKWSWEGVPVRSIEAISAFYSIGARSSPDHNGTSRILSVLPSTTASDMGLQKGDIVTRVNNHSPSGMSPRSLKGLLKTPGTTLLVKRDQSEITLLVPKT